MADKILHKRNLSTGNVPTTSSLDAGELAINVADGKLFLRQSGSIANKIVTVGESASFAATASFITASGVYGPYGANSIVSSSRSISSSFAATASYVTPLQQNVIITGSIYIPDNTHSIYFSGSNAASRLVWNDTDGTLDLGLKGGNVTLQIGQEQVVRVVNKTGANLLESQYKVARIRRVDEGGAQGQRLAIVLAQANNDANSVDTLGIVTENIDDNQEGFITNSGLVRNIDTTGTLQGETWTDGDVLYLSPTTPGALTTTKPQAPDHTVIMGYVVYAHNNQGKIFVKVDNGYEIDELHNVRITTASLAAGQLLVRSGSNATGVWINTNQLTGSYGLTGSLTATHITASDLYAGPTYISGSLIVNGQSTFYGTASFVNVTASNLFVSESFISVNVFEPVERFGGLKVYDSGSSTATASLAWDSLHNHWVYQNVDGATYTGGMLLAGPRNTGSLGDEPNLTKWFVPRSDGGDHLENSQIFTSGSVTQVTGSLRVSDGIYGTGSVSFRATDSTTNSVFNLKYSGSNINILDIRGDGRLLLGYSASNNATGGFPQYAIAIGHGAIVGGQSENYGSSIAIGYDAQATAAGGIAIGNITRPSTGIAIGHNVQSRAESVAIAGSTTDARGTVIGFGSSNSGYGGSAIGYDVDNSGGGSFLVGYFHSNSIASSFIWGNNGIKFLVNGNSNLVLSNNSPITEANKASYFDTAATNTITITSGSIPNTTISSSFQLYAATGSVSNNVRPHFRTGTGTTVWLGDESRLFNVTASRTTLSASNATSNGPTLTVYGSGSTQPVFTVQGSQGELFSVTDSLSGSLFSVNDISGLPILEVFSDNTTLIGNYLDPMLITTAKVTQTNSGSFTVYALPTASYDTAFFEYSIKSGSNARAGTIMAIQSGSSVNFTETTTTDFGTTSAVTFGVFVTGSNMALTGSSTSGAWTIKSIVRGL